MKQKPFEVYGKSDWKFFTASKIEGQWFERKGQIPGQQPKGIKEFRDKLAKTVCAFANSNPDFGGLLAVGIGDKGEIFGIDRFGEEYLNNILEFLQLLDGFVPEHKLVEVINEDGESDHIIFIYTHYLSQRVARTSDGECYKRQGDKTVTLRSDQAQALSYEKGELHFEDEQAIPFDESDLEPGVLKELKEQYLQQNRFNNISDTSVLLRLARLTQNKNGEQWLTKGGLLVLHKDPRHLIPGSYARYLRYNGRIESSSALIRDEQFEGPIPIIIQKLREFLPTQIGRFSYRRDGILVSEDEYPTTAWDEAIVNALVHRSYSLQTRPVWIKQFEDRLEIISPGSYPLGVTPDNLIHTPRNTRLMEALRHLNFVRMAEEGTKAMREAMRNASLPLPLYSDPELDRVICTLFNNIDERTKAREDLGIRAKISHHNITLNIYPLIISSPPEAEEDAPFSESLGRPLIGEIREAFSKALKKANFRLNSFANTTAVNFTDEYFVPELYKRELVSIYPGFEFRLIELKQLIYLVVDHTVEVRNRANLSRVLRALPWLPLNKKRRCFVRLEKGWLPGFILEPISMERTKFLVELKEDHTNPIDSKPKIIEVPSDKIIPELNTTSELPALLQAEGVKVQLIQEIRKASLMSVENAPRRRFERVQELVSMLSKKIFPLIVANSQIHLSQSPAEINKPPVFLGQKLREPKALFDRHGFKQEEDILRGLTTFGSFEQPRQELSIVTVCPPSWSVKMQSFINRLRQGHQKYKGIESTFGVRFGNVTTIISDIFSYQTKIKDFLSQIPNDKRPVFIVFTPERGSSRADYNSIYYQVKRLLLEAGYPSQMVKEETLENPDWKDLNFALDVFAKAGFVPWVLSEGMPQVDLFIGLSSSNISFQGQRQRVTGYANIFDEFGRWLYYQGSSAAVLYDERNHMFADLLGDIVRSYQAQRRKLQWVHIHHSARLNKDDRNEIARGILNEAPEAEINFVYINEYNAFRLFDNSPLGDGAAERGIWVKLSYDRFLLATMGKNSIGQKYLGTPRPLEVRVNRIGANGELDLQTYAQHVLSLTRLNWASTRSFSHAPITIKFASDIAYLTNVFLTSGGNFRLHKGLQNTPWFL